jgi:hypothetical protein
VLVEAESQVGASERRELEKGIHMNSRKRKEDSLNYCRGKGFAHTAEKFRLHKFTYNAGITRED